MPDPVPSLDAGESAGAAFAATEWSVVLDARSDSTRRRQALERLCADYWLPTYGYLRRQGHAPADAEDLTQGFFVHVLGSDFLDRPDPARGKFRCYLIGALRHFLGSHFERENALKRGGGAQLIDWSEIDAEGEYSAVDQSPKDASEVYETTWALALLGRAFRRLQDEQSTPAKAARFSALSGFLTAVPSRGDYDQAAGVLGSTRTHVAVWVHRLNRRYGELVRMEVAATVRDPAEVKQEMEHLLQALRS